MPGRAAHRPARTRKGCGTTWGAGRAKPWRAFRRGWACPRAGPLRPGKRLWRRCHPRPGGACNLWCRTTWVWERAGASAGMAGRCRAREAAFAVGRSGVGVRTAVCPAFLPSPSVSRGWSRKDLGFREEDLVKSGLWSPGAFPLERLCKWCSPGAGRGSGWAWGSV